MRIFHIPKVQMSLALFLVGLAAIVHLHSFLGGFIIIWGIICAIVSDLIFTFIRKRTVFMPYAAVVSGIIIGLLSAPATPWYQVLVISLLAMGMKNFIRLKERHVFNPAAFGLFITGMIFHQTVSWWGASFQTFPKSLSFLQILSFLILLLPFYISGYRMKRYISIGSFLVGYGIFFLLQTGSVSSALTVFTDPTVLFFSFVMLPEPMTSPISKMNQLFYGISITIFIVLFSYVGKNIYPGIFVDGLLPALLMGNALFFKFR